MRAWVEIDTKNLKFNILKFKELINHKKILGVVKANAYGLGVLEISKLLVDVGVNFFGVANLEEAIELRESNKKINILVLGASFLEDFKKAENNDIHLSISSFDALQYLKNNKLNTPIHLKFDTGMTRLGFSLNDVEKAIDFCTNNNLNLKGIFSHLSDTDLLNEESKIFTLNQIEKFKKITENISLEYIHISNSAGVTNYNDFIVGNLVRLGLGMYGFSGDRKDERLRNVFTIKAKVVHIRKVTEDSFVSYGRTFKLASGETYAILAIGYADGIKKYLNKGGYVIINGIKCDIIGNICMDMTTIKIPKILENKIAVGDTAIVLNSDIINDLDIPELCTWDIMSNIGKRVKKIYI